MLAGLFVLEDDTNRPPVFRGSDRKNSARREVHARRQLRSLRIDRERAASGDAARKGRREVKLGPVIGYEIW